jgi:hypothetical protein
METTTLKKTAIAETITKSFIIRNGILMMDGKGFLALDCKQYLDDIIDETVLNINILQDLTPEEIADLFMRLNKSTGGDSGSAKFFSDTGRNMIFIGSVFQESIVFQKLAKNNLTTLVQIVSQVGEKTSEGEHPLIALVKNHPDFGIEGTLLTDAALSFGALQENDGETLKNVMATVNAWFAPFFQNKLLRKWCDSETSDIDVTQILWGRRIGICLPEAKFPTAGAMICKFLKARFYKAIQMRGDDWKKKGMSKVFFMVDEVQKLVDSSDLAMLPIARSLGLSCIFATQNIDSYYAELGSKDKALALMDSFRSIICFQSSAPTYDYIRDRIGKDRVWVEQIQTGMISYGLSNKLNMASPMFDPNNQYRGWMKHFSMGAIKKFFKRSTVGSLQGDGKAGLGERFATMQLSEQPIHILQDKDIQLVNNKKFHAVALLSRGGAPRRDIIQTIPLGNDFEPLKITLKDKLAAAKARFGGAK